MSSHPPESPDRDQAPSGPAAIFAPFFNLIVAPKEAFRSFDARPLLSLWVLLWIVVCLVGLTLLNVDVTRDFMRVGMVQGMQQQGQDVDPEQMSRMMEQMERWAPAWAMAGTVAAVVGILLVALFLWAGSTMAGANNRFGRAFSVATGAAVAHPLLYTAFVSLMWWMNPPEVRRVEDIYTATPSLGLDLVVGGAELSPMLRTFLQRIDVFHLWWLVLVVIGAQLVLRMKRGAAIATAAVIWAITATVAALMAGLGG